MKVTRFKCTICGKVTTGRKPRGGDGTFYFPRSHPGADGKPCPGNVEEAEWVEGDATPAEAERLSRARFIAGCPPER